MLKLCKNHSKSFKVPFGGARKKERKRKRSDFFFLFCVRSLLPSLPCFPFSILVCFFPPQSSFVIIPFRLSPPPPPPPLPPCSFFDFFPPFQPLSLSLSLSYSLHFLLLLSIKLWQPTKTKRITTQGIGI